MSAQFTLPEEAIFAALLPPAADAAGRTSAAAVSLKNAHKAYLIYHINQGNAATILLTPQQATSVAKGSAKALANNVRIWTDLDNATSTVLTRQSDGVAYTTDAAVKDKFVIFEIDPASLDQAGGFDCILAITGASNAANITSAFVLIVPARSVGVNALAD